MVMKGRPLSSEEEERQARLRAKWRRGGRLGRRGAGIGAGIVTTGGGLAETVAKKAGSKIKLPKGIRHPDSVITNKELYFPPGARNNPLTGKPLESPMDLYFTGPRRRRIRTRSRIRRLRQ